MIVADTQVLVYLAVGGDQTKRAEQAYRRDPRWAAPPLWRSEFRNVLTQYRRRGLLSTEEAFMAMTKAELLVEEEITVSSAEVLKLAFSSRCSAYDCEFVAAAIGLGVPLLTADRQILAEFPTIAVSLDTFSA